MNQIQIRLFFIVRVIKLVARYPILLKPIIYRLSATFIPFFKVKVEYIPNKYQLKVNDITQQKNVGHARGNRTYNLMLLNRKLNSALIKEGNIATALQFFIERPISDLEFLNRNLISNYIKLNKSTTVFEPGCGTARHLTYLSDKFGCICYGIDPYESCINIAKVVTSTPSNSININCISAFDIDRLEKLVPKNIDLVYMNSWLNHVIHNKDYFKFINLISQRSNYLALISHKKHKPIIAKYLKGFQMIKDITVDNTNYSLHKSL